MNKNYETVIGLEVHIELATDTKIFCGCSTKFGARSNANTCPVCTGMPGALPVLNKKVVDYAIALGKATGCEITRYSRFDRKNYFYPDNPQNYQISQLYMPICRDGYIEIEIEHKISDGNKISADEISQNGVDKIGENSKKSVKKIVRIHEMHMEEDAGKLIHDEEEKVSLIDYNRSGVPLIEIVSEPDMRSADEVIAYLEKLRMICQYLGVSDCKLQEGSMRVDVNLSVREVGRNTLGQRTEMKNLNSFRAIARAIEAEAKRQIELIESGKEVIQETRRWDDTKGMSYPMRSKEDAKDYRYFPEPDVQPLVITEEWIEDIASKQPEFQQEKETRYKVEYGLSDYDANILTQNRHMAEMYEETVRLCGNPKKAANWYMGEVLRTLKEKAMDPEELTFSPKHLAAILKAMEEGKINQGNAQKVFAKVFDEDIEPLKYMEEQGLMMVSDMGAIEAAVDEVLTENPSTVKEFHSGKDRVFGFLVGQVMKNMKGKGDPAKVNEVLKQKLTTSLLHSKI